MAAGTYSSIFLATPIEVSLREREPSIKAHTAKVLASRSESGIVVGSNNAKLVAAGAGDSIEVVRGGHQGTQAQPRRKKR